MKKLILSFIVTFILSAGMSSDASKGTITLKAIVGHQSDVTQFNEPQTIDPAFSDNISKMPIFLLLAIGMLGLTGVSRKNN